MWLPKTLHAQYLHEMRLVVGIRLTGAILWLPIVHFVLHLTSQAVTALLSVSIMWHFTPTPGTVTHQCLLMNSFRCTSVWLACHQSFYLLPVQRNSHCIFSYSFNWSVISYFTETQHIPSGLYSFNMSSNWSREKLVWSWKDDMRQCIEDLWVPMSHTFEINQ